MYYWNGSQIFWDNFMHARLAILNVVRIRIRIRSESNRALHRAYITLGAWAIYIYIGIVVADQRNGGRGQDGITVTWRQWPTTHITYQYFLALFFTFIWRFFFSLLFYLQSMLIFFLSLWNIYFVCVCEWNHKYFILYFTARSNETCSV